MRSEGEDCQTLLLDMKHYHSSSDFGLYKDEQKSNRIIFWLKGTVVLVVLSTLFFVILHITINASKEVEPTYSSTSNTELTEKFIISPMETETSPTALPKPFDVKLSGMQPHIFMPTLPTTSRTTLRVPTKYPQLTNYRNNYYPQNIQDVIRFITESPVANNNNEKRQVPDSRRAIGRRKKLEFVDPLQQFKPNDPSEVNLLATDDVRFAPPAWKDFHRFNQVRQNTLQQQIIPLNTQIDSNQDNNGDYPKPPSVNLMGTFTGSMNMPFNPLNSQRFNQVRQQTINQHIIPLVPQRDNNQEKNIINPTPPNVNSMGSYAGSMNMPFNPHNFHRFNQVRQTAFQQQAIPIMKDYMDKQNSDDNGPVPSIVNHETGSYPAPMDIPSNLHDNKIIDQQSGSTNVGEIFKKPFMVTLSVYPGTSQNMDPKLPEVPDFRPLQGETWRNADPGHAAGMHMFLKVFPAVSYPTAYHQ